MITGQSTIIGVIGDPIRHSLSPQMHNQAIRTLSLPFVYVPFHVNGRRVDHLLDALDTLGIHGVNVTVPHKESVFRLVDQHTERARLAGSVNTLYRHEGQWIGDSTDGDGFCCALQDDLHVSPKDRKVAIIGAGGSASSIAVAALQAQCAELTLINRTVSRAEELAASLRTHFTTPIHTLSLDDTQSATCLGQHSLVIQTTSVGMNSDHASPIAQFDWVTHDHVVCDIIYSPTETYFLAQARQKGAKTANGLGMLAGQGVLAFECFTGHLPDYNAYKQTLEALIGQ